jgi:Protein of unknown function (DUF3429)
MNEAPPLPRIAFILGIAGLAPQVWALLAGFSDADRYIGLAAGYFYAALILSFLGGLWWGIAASRKDAPTWLYAAAVVPSLIAFASGIPWMIGAAWPGPSLAYLGLAILASALIDRRLLTLRLINRSLWLLRLALSVGLGTLTLLLATR